MTTGLITAPATILLAEQDREESRTIQGWLETYGYRVQTAKDRKKILSAVPMLSLVLLSTDVASGLEVCRELKSSDSFLPLILLANGSSYDISAYLDAGADEVITHPLEPEILIAKVRAMLRLKDKFDALEQHNQQLSHELAKRNREAEKVLRETRDLQVLKDTIVRNVSHELRTPMLQIKSAVAMLVEDARTASPGGVSTLADHATAATAKLESIVQNITQLASSLNVSLEPFHVADAINSVTRVLQRQWALSGDIDRIRVLAQDCASCSITHSSSVRRVATWTSSSSSRTQMSALLCAITALVLRRINWIGYFRHFIRSMVVQRDLLAALE
jgi:CheY-like chemotaxis protein